jgi:hypothetical protein
MSLPFWSFSRYQPAIAIAIAIYCFQPPAILLPDVTSAQTSSRVQRHRSSLLLDAIDRLTVATATAFRLAAVVVICAVNIPF